MSNDNRVPAGSPEGGQWAAGSNPETMTDEMFFERTGLTPQDVIEGCRKLGLRFAQRSPGLLDADEIADRTMEEFMKAVRSDKPIDNARSYLKTKAHGVAVHGVVGTSRGPDIKAVGEWLTRRTAWENEHNEQIPDTMSHELAQQVRDEFIERGEQPPTKDFHMRSRYMAHASLDAMTTDDDGRRRDHVDANSTLGSAPMLQGEDARRSREVDDLIRNYENIQTGPKRNSAEAKRAMRQVYVDSYATMCDEDAPMLKEHSLSASAASQFSATVKESGGAYSVASKITEGEASMTERLAFMAPFGQGHSDSDSERTARTIMSAGPAGADKMWLALNQAATEETIRPRDMYSKEEAVRHAKRLGASQRKLAAEILTQRSGFTPEGKKVAQSLLAPWRHADVTERSKALQRMASARSSSDAKAIWDAAMAMETR